MVLALALRERINADMTGLLRYKRLKREGCGARRSQGETMEGARQEKPSGGLQQTVPFISTLSESSDFRAIAVITAYAGGSVLGLARWAYPV